MSITIDDLDEPLAEKLRVRANIHGRSLAAEAREILVQAVAGMDTSELGAPTTAEEIKARLKALRGIWKERGTTDELMNLTRSEG